MADHIRATIHHHCGINPEVLAGIKAKLTWVCTPERR
jgi:hypothetical protein